jgi:hypothetical protein
MDPYGQLIRSGAGYVVTYEAVADPSGSINATSVDKSNFWQYAQSLFGLLDPLPPDTGLTGVAMPGPVNAPQAMSYDAANAWWVAEGVPLTPYDDALSKNPYPMFRIRARSAAGTLLASTDIVAPVSDEMACKACHASGSGPAARPAAGWVDDPDPERDYRLNVIRLHDERRGASAGYAAMLVRHGYDAAGLYPTVMVDGRPILCATCHASNALGTGGEAGVPPLTGAVHALHSSVIDPGSGLALEDIANRSACYACHPGSTTRCLRGAMGNAVAANGSMAIQCQNCHGRMSMVGSAGRVGWLDEPTCQNCHTGTAVHNNGRIRYTDVYDTDGQRRVAVDPTFATTPDTPAPGLSLYRFSTGHGGIKCEGCHGSTHAEYPSSHRNDNVQSIALQGHAGVLVECTTCHATPPTAIDGGPHGMHPVGQGWVSSHPDAVEANGISACRACHGVDDRGTVLSYGKGDRTLATDFGPRHFWIGSRIGCYACHDGPASDQPNPNHPAVVADAAATSSGMPTAIALVAHDADGDALVLRVVSQPAHATVSISGATATFYPGYAGPDAFTYAAWDGDSDSNLGRVLVDVLPDRIFGNGFDGS